MPPQQQVQKSALKFQKVATTAMAMLVATTSILSVCASEASPASAACLGALQSLQLEPRLSQSALPLGLGHTRCSAQKPTYEAILEQCNFSKTLIQKQHASDVTEGDLLQREFVKQVLDLEVFWISRIPRQSPIFEEAWALLGKALLAQSGLLQNALKVDEQFSLKNERCFLHASLGVPCFGIRPEVAQAMSFVEIRKAKAVNDSANLLVGRKLPASVVYDLLTYRLLIAGELKPEIQMRNAILRHYPELVSNANLVNALDSILRNRSLITDYQNSLRNKTATFGQKKNLSESLILASVQQRGLREDLVQGIEKMFLRAIENGIAEATRQIEASEKDPKWILQQNFLLKRKLQASINKSNLIASALYQSLVCENIEREQKSQDIDEKIYLWMGAAALATGGASLLPLAPAVSMSLFLASVGISTASGVYILAQDASDYEHAQKMFLMREVNYDAVEKAGQEFLSDVPHVIINLALVSPLYAMQAVNRAEQLARVAQDLEFLQQIPKIKKGILLILAAGNGWLTYDSIEIAIPAVKRQLFATEQKAPNQTLVENQ